MKTLKYMFVFAFLLCGVAFAQDAAAAVAASTGNVTADSILTWLTPIVVPLILAGVKQVLPKLPPFAMPILAPILGILIDLVNTYGLHHTGNIALAAAAGLAGVGLREVKETIKPAVNGGWPTPNP